MLSRVCIVVLAWCLAACAMPTSKDVSDRWVGKNIGVAIAQLGPPQSTVPLPDGVTIYTWEQQYGSAMAIKRATCRTGLHANKEGTIIAASQLSESLLCK